MTDTAVTDPWRGPPLFAAHPSRIVLIWLAVRTVVWTVAVSLGQTNAQIDMAEWGAWGGVFQWGYPKHPPLAAWLAGLFLRLSPGDVWGLYLAGYLCSAGCLWAAWKLANEFLPPHRALFAVLALDGLAYLTNDAADFSNNIVLNLFWALATWTAFVALRTGRWFHWAAFGGCVGLAILTKYTVGLLVVSLAVYVLANGPARRNLRFVGPYLSVAVALAVVAPHLVWLVRNEFITLHYISERTDVAPDLVSRLLNPLHFLTGQIGLLLPVAIILLPLLRWRGGVAGSRRFLHAAVLGPLAGFLAVSLATGGGVRVVWASPLWTFAGVWLVAVFGGAFTVRAVRWAFRLWAVFAVGLLTFAVSFQWLEPRITGNAGRTLFPGKALTEEINRLWAARYDRPFAIAAGDAWRAGNLCLYAPHRPTLYSSGSMGYFEFDAKTTPWTSDEDFRARGGVMVWDANMDHEGTIDKVRRRFPTAELLPVIELPYQTTVPVKPARTGLAFLPPPK